MRSVRNKIRSIFFVGALVLSYSASGQNIGGLLNKVKKGAENLSKPLSWEPGKFVSTSLKDTLPGIYWLNEITESQSPTPTTSFSLKPGYYKTTIRSYCLHAGTYGPSRGAGYQVANFEGSKKKLIISILEKSPQHPDVAQSDIQTLIWGIEAGTKFSAYPNDFKIRIKPLLSVKDIALMEVGVDDIVEKTLPDNVKSLMNTYASLRNEMQSAQMSYDNLEQIAVKVGAPPLGLGSITIDQGKWSYIDNGFFLRIDPRGYSTSDIALYRPAPVEVGYDSQNRLSSYSYDGQHVTVNYQGSGQTIKIGDHQGKLQKIESYTVQDASGKPTTYPSGEQYIDLGQNLVHDILKGAKDFNLDQIIKENTGLSLDKLQAAFDNVEKWQNRYKDLKNLNDAFDLDNRPPADLDKYINETAVNERIHSGLEAALNPLDKKGQSEWIAGTLRMVGDFFLYSICKLRGDDCAFDDKPKKPNLPEYIAQPGNTSAQRLGLSEYVKN